jgi:hypothetical protein
MNEIAHKPSHFNVLKPFTMQWWQVGCFKLGMLALGITVGAYWHDFFGRGIPLLIAVAVLCLAYITYVWVRERA